MKTALITGITGQDGAFLAEHLLRAGYRVFGTYRRTSTSNFWRIEALGIQDHPELQMLEYDVTDLASSLRLLERAEPDEIYNLAAQSFVHVSFNQPLATAAITGLGPVNLLEAIRTINPRIRFYQASTAEMFGSAPELPQGENTPFHPRSPYGAAKLYAHWMTVNYRDSYGIFAASGILFNHESPLRGPEFVTRKITLGVAKIAAGRQSVLRLGHLGARRDWGYARDYVGGMWAMLQVEQPDTFVMATGRTETVRNFATLAFRAAGIEVHWEGEGVAERGLNARTGQPVVVVDPSLYRPAEVEVLIGNPEKAQRILGWRAETELESLCQMMVDADMQRENGRDAPPAA